MPTSWHTVFARLLKRLDHPARAIRIPREFELTGSEALLRNEGGRLIIEPAPKKTLLEGIATFGSIGEDFPHIERLPTRNVSDFLRNPNG